MPCVRSLRPISWLRLFASTAVSALMFAMGCSAMDRPACDELETICQDAMSADGTACLHLGIDPVVPDLHCSARLESCREACAKPATGSSSSGSGH